MNSKLREDFYRKYENFFHTFTEPGFELDYALYGTVGLSSEFYKEVQYATKAMWHIITKVRDHVLTLTYDELIDLGYSPKIIKYLSDTHLSYDTVASRFDIIRKGDTFKFIELNNDTPFLIVENFFMNDEVLKEFGLSADIKQKDSLFLNSMRRVVNESLLHINKTVYEARVIVMSYTEEEDYEDYLTAKYYFDTLRKIVPFAEHVAFSDVIVDTETQQVRLKNGSPVDILLKPSYPYEFLIEDDENIGIDLMELSRQGKVALISTPRAHVMQNKSLFALITKYKEEGVFFTQEEAAFIDMYVPKTYFTPDVLEACCKPYVSKPVIGREGQSVEVHYAGAINHKSRLNAYDSELRIYQEYLDLPTRTVVLNNTYKRFEEVIGVFVVEGEYAGSVVRLGNTITEWDSHWIAAYKSHT